MTGYVYWAAAAAFDGACAMLALVSLRVMLDAVWRGADRLGALRAQRREPVAEVAVPVPRKAIAAFTLSPHVIYLEPVQDRRNLARSRPQCIAQRRRA